MKQKLKNEKGITLVALVITIIVLLILAGVTLSMVMGESGIFGKANSAKEKTKLSNAEETIRLAVLENQVKSVSGDVALTNDQLKEEIAKKLTEQGYTVSGSTVTYYGDKTIDIENYLEKESAPTITWTWADTDNSGTKNVGDVVTDSTGEKFYIMLTEGDKYALLAEKNIDTSTIKQSDSANKIVFANAEDISKTYGTAKGGEGRLMTYSEMSGLTSTHSAMIYGTNTTKGYLEYWLDSDLEFDNTYVICWYGGHSSYTSRPKTDTWCVRPVIEISKDLIK